MTLGSRIRECRLEQGLSLHDLSEKLNVSESTVLRYEKGVINKLSEKTIQIIADALGVSVSYLLGEQETIKPENKTKSYELTMSEQVLVSCYRSLEDHDRSVVRALILAMNANACRMRQLEDTVKTAEDFIADLGETKEYQHLLEGKNV